MKKAIVLSVLGLAASGMAAFGQGAIVFNNYVTFTYEPVYYNPTASLAPSGLAGKNADTTTEVQLFYAVGSYGSTAAFLAAATAGNTAFITASYNGAGTYGGIDHVSNGGLGGYYSGGTQSIGPGWASGDTVTFLVEGWETAGLYGGATYSASTLRGQSALWTENAAIVSSSLPANNMANGPTSLELSIVPEPDNDGVGWFGSGSADVLPS
jgi:hypothetical protein